MLVSCFALRNQDKMPRNREEADLFFCSVTSLQKCETRTEGSKFDSNLGGSAIRYGEVPGALGVLESPDNPMPIGIAIRIEWAEPRTWRCSGSRSTRRISPSGGCAKTDGSCWSKSERGRGAGAAQRRRTGRGIVSRQWRRAPRGVGREAVDPCAGRNRSGMIRTPRVRAPDPHRDQGRRADPQISPHLPPPSLIAAPSSLSPA